MQGQYWQGDSSLVRTDVSIANQTRQTVAFPPEQSTKTRIDFSREPVIARLSDAAEKIAIQILPLPGKSPGHGLRFRIVNRATKQPVLASLSETASPSFGSPETLNAL